VTLITAQEFLRQDGIQFGGYMAVALVPMDRPRSC
jgi:hypothetical protein